MVALTVLVFIAVVLTCAMFFSKNMMLGFPSMMFWAIAGAQSYTLSSIPWGDWQYYLFFASFGMAIFSALAMYSLREKRDTIADEEMERGDGKLIGDDDKEKDMFGDDEEAAVIPSERSRRLRERAEKRRSKPIRKGEFDF